ncbi:ATP-dependent RNA helicase DHX8 [Dirofilaria immitis]|nr:ATP-dependent RNA helicase DHX8 [Dirofilaria immitis]
MNHEIERFACGLPVYNIRKDIQNILCKQSRVLIIIADTGSGKSTQIPQYLAFDGIITASQKILCSQPRKFGCVMIDEVHERTVNTDMCLGMMKRVLQLRPDMKLVITSATLDPEPLLNYFAEFQGVNTPSRFVMSHQSPDAGSEAKKQPFEDIPWEYSLETHAAHIMAFLSNPRETLIAEERLAKRLAELKHSVQVKIITLYGNMPLENRAEVFASLEPGYHHKVIFATNIGETSITIPGVRYIVDCKKFDAIRRKNVLELSLISKSAAKQRAGRAGRTAPDAGIMNPAEFDFIEKPNSGALLHSQALLRSLQAIECCETKLVLTQLGKKMKQLPVEPRLAKMVLDSVQYDLVAEAAVVSAYIHVGSLFYRGNNQNKFILADQKKLSFCEESGDPMTSLAGVSADINKIDISKARRIIPNLFCRSFGSNLAMYSGLPEHEYYDFNEKKYVFIHPSSALKYSDVTPEFIVYECSLYTSKDFVLNNKLVPYNVRCGAVIKQWIMEHMDIIHQEVSKECMWKKRFDDPYHRLQIYVPVKDLPKLHMSGSGTPLEILMPDEFCSMYVGSGGINWKDDAAYRMELEEYFGRFGKITEFVTFDEKYQKKIGHSCIIRMESKEAAKRAFICSSENRCDFNIEPRFGRKYFDKIGNYRPSAYRLLIKWWRRPSYGHGQIKLKSRDFDQRMHAFDVISKHLGRFQPSLLSEHLSIKLLSVPLDIDSKQLLHIFGPLLNAYGIEFDEIYVVRKKIYPVEDEMALEEHSQRISDHIIKVAKDSVNSNSYPFEVKIRAPKHPGEIEFVAFVLFSDMDLGIRVGNALKEAAENGLPLEMGPLNQMHEAHVQQLFQYQMKVPRALFNAIFGDLRNIYNGIDHEHVDFNHHSDGKICHLFIAGEDFNFVNEVKAAVDKIINGCTIKCRDGERIDGVELPCHRLLTKVGQDFLRNLPQKYTIFLNISLYKMEVRIQGSISNVEKAKMEIKRFLREWLDADINQTLILQPPDYQPGTLKTLLAQNGYDLYSLEKQFGHGLHLDANIVRRELSFIGKEAQFQDLLNMLRSISDSIRSKDFSETAFNEVEIPKCVICLCVADLENYCLEVCGHYACRSCLNMQLKTSIETRHFPIVCVACEKPFTWSDLEVLVLENLDRNKDEDPQKLQSLSDASLACFVERHGDLYKHCLTPNCRGLHPVTIDAGLGRCRLCGRVQCTKCGKEEHESITCEEYAILKINADESVRKWIREDQTTRRICPNQNCQAVIEKLGGCNHMQCLQCKQHFCWICMFAATESNEIYAHMDAEHGGSGADMRELIAEMENDPFIREYIERQHPALLLDPEFNFGEEAEFWIMHDEDAVDELFMANNDEQELNELFNEGRDEPSVGFEVHTDFEEDEEEDANIV